MMFMQKRTAKILNSSEDKLQSKAVLWDHEDECPQCGSSLETLWFMECCGLVMCDVCRENHDKKMGYSIKPDN